MESLARNMFYGRWEHHFLESNEELGRGSTQRTRIYAESPPSAGYIRQQDEGETWDTHCFPTDNLPLKSHHVLPQLLLRKLPLGVSQESLSHSRRLLRRPLLSECERRRCSLLAQQLSGPNLGPEQRPGDLQWTHQLPASQLRAQQLGNFQLPFRLLRAKTRPRNQLSACFFLPLRVLPVRVLQAADPRGQQLATLEHSSLRVSPLGFLVLWPATHQHCVQRPQTSAPCLQWMPDSALCVQPLPSILLYLRRPVASLFQPIITLKIPDENSNSARFCSSPSSDCFFLIFSWAWSNESCSFPIFILFPSLLSIKLWFAMLFNVDWVWEGFIRFGL